MQHERDMVAWNKGVVHSVFWQAPDHFHTPVFSWTQQRWREILIPLCKYVKEKYQQKLLCLNKLDANWIDLFSSLSLSFFFFFFFSKKCFLPSGTLKSGNNLTLFKMLLDAFREKTIWLGLHMWKEGQMWASLHPLWPCPYHSVKQVSESEANYPCWAHSHTIKCSYSSKSGVLI